jgi:MFS transporter, DHA1 family, inner membrane transport protein
MYFMRSTKTGLAAWAWNLNSRVSKKEQVPNMTMATTAPSPAVQRRLLLVLGALNFIVGMGAFVVVGVMTTVADAMQISKATAGWTLTIYAIVYAITSPILISVTGQFDRQRIVLVGIVVFLCGSVTCGLATDFPILLVGRAMMAVGGGLVTPVTASLGVALVAPSERGRALAIVFGGLTLAQVTGVPVGAWLGYAYGWSSAFFAVAILAAFGLLAVMFLVPSGIPVPRTSLATLGSVLLTLKLLIAILFTAFFVGGLYTVYTFLVPFLESRFALGRDGVTVFLTVFGIGAVVGNSVGGFLTDRIGTTKTLAIVAVSQLILMPILTIIPMTIYLTGLMIGLWSIFAWSFNVPQQVRLASLDGPRTPVLLSLNAAAIYVGGSVGSLVGGQVLQQGGVEKLGLGGAALVGIALFSLSLTDVLKTRKIGDAA